MAAGLVFVVALVFSIWWMGPAPPRQIVLATGEPQGAYAAIGRDFQARLQRLGLRLDLRSSEGSVDNLKLLLAGKADVAFVQAASFSAVEDDSGTLRALVAIQAEPVWVFYRGEPLQHLSELDRRRRKIAVGLKSSGTAVLANALLRANGVNDAEILHIGMRDTARQLTTGAIDVGFFVTSGSNPLLDKLLRDPNVRLLSFSRQLAYTRHFPYLSAVVLGEGAVDLEKDLPAQDVKMFATSTVLVSRAELHASAVEQLLIAARRLHSQTTLVSGTQTYPTLGGIDAPIHDAAQAYMSSGESLAARVLPYWGVLWLFKIQILLLPLLLVWLPFFRLLPLAYRMRINWLLRRHYAALREIDERIDRARSAEELQEQIKLLDELRRYMEKVSRKVPHHLQINVYQWRLHVSHVRAEAADRLWRLNVEKQQPEAAMS